MSPVANSEIPSDIVGLGDRGLTIDRETFASFTMGAPFNIPSVRSLSANPSKKAPTSAMSKEFNGPAIGIASETTRGSGTWGQ
jgi:hypothetical protein